MVTIHSFSNVITVNTEDAGWSAPALLSQLGSRSVSSVHINVNYDVESCNSAYAYTCLGFRAVIAVVLKRMFGVRCTR